MVKTAICYQGYPQKLCIVPQRTEGFIKMLYTLVIIRCNFKYTHLSGPWSGGLDLAFDVECSGLHDIPGVATDENENA